MELTPGQALDPGSPQGMGNVPEKIHLARFLNLLITKF